MFLDNNAEPVKLLKRPLGDPKSSDRSLFDTNKPYRSGDHGPARPIRQFNLNGIVETPQYVPMPPVPGSDQLGTKVSPHQSAP